MDGFFHKDNKTRESLINSLQIDCVSESDLPFIQDTIADIFCVPSKQIVKRQISSLNIDLDSSVKAFDPIDGQIYGFLLVGAKKIDDDLPFVKSDDICDIICEIMPNQLNGFVFALDKRIRGCGIDKKMLKCVHDKLPHTDIIWCGVNNNLSSHNYWKRMGFLEFCKDDQVTLYIFCLNKMSVLKIFITILTLLYEKYYNKRRSDEFHAKAWGA